jgi:SRSO17 transposase
MATPRRACASAPAPLEAYCEQFDPLLATYGQRNSFRRYLEGLLLPRDRTKTLTALAGAEPIAGAQAAAVQRLQFFLSESRWEAETINHQRLMLLLSAPETRPHAGGVLVIDETGDRKWGSQTAHLGRQYLGSRGKVESGIVSVSSLWTDERLYYPLHVEPYTPAPHFPKGKSDPARRTKPQIALERVRRAQALGVPFRATVADCLYGENHELIGELLRAKVPFVLGLRAREGRWAPALALHTAEEAAHALGWKSAKRPGKWKRLVRHFRDCAGGSLVGRRVGLRPLLSGARPAGDCRHHRSRETAGSLDLVCDDQPAAAGYAKGRRQPVCTGGSSGSGTAVWVEDLDGAEL